MSAPTTGNRIWTGCNFGTICPEVPQGIVKHILCAGCQKRPAIWKARHDPVRASDKHLAIIAEAVPGKAMKSTDEILRPSHSPSVEAAFSSREPSQAMGGRSAASGRASKPDGSLIPWSGLTGHHLTDSPAELSALTLRGVENKFECFQIRLHGGIEKINEVKSTSHISENPA